MLEFTTSGDVLLVLLKGGGGLTGEGLGKGGDLLTLLEGERQPSGLLGGQPGLGSEGDWGVKEGRGGGDDDTVGTELGNGLLGELLGGGEVGLPDVSAGDETEGQDELGRLDSSDDVFELSWLTVEVDVESGDGEVLEELDGLAYTTKVGGEGDWWGNLGQGLVNLGVLGTQ